MFELALAILAFSAFCAFVEAMQKVLVARAKRPACACRCLHSATLTPGAVFELPPGTKVTPATEAELRTTFSAEGSEVIFGAFEDARDALDIERAKKDLASDEEHQRLQGEIRMLRVNLRRERRGLPLVARD